MLLRRDWRGFDVLLPWVHISSKWLTRLVSFLCFSLFNIYCLFYFSYYSNAISFSSESFPSFMYMLSCNLMFCLRKSSSKNVKASTSWFPKLELVFLPSPNAITLKLLILSMVYWTIFVMLVFMEGMEVVGTTFGIYLFASSALNLFVLYVWGSSLFFRWSLISPKTL